MSLVSESALAHEAVEILPLEIRQDYLGIAFEKVADLRDDPRGKTDKLRAVRGAIRRAYVAEDSGHFRENPIGRNRNNRAGRQVNQFSSVEDALPAIGIESNPAAELEKQEILNALPENLRQIAKYLDAGSTQAEIAVLLGISQQMISRMLIEIRGRVVAFLAGEIYQPTHIAKAA